jgi:ADP-heptose:LPS heptosyltransferase
MLLSTKNVAVQRAVNPYVDDILLYDKSAGGLGSIIRSIRRQRYDVVVDLMDNPSTTSTLIMRWCGARYRLGIHKSNAGVYTHVVPLLDRREVHIARRIAELLAAFGVSPEVVDLRPSYPVDREEQLIKAAELGLDVDHRRPRVGINASGSGSGRCYPVTATIGIVTQLEKNFPHVEFYLFSDPANANWVEQVAVATNAKAVAPSRSFHQAAVAWSLMDAIWTPDTSVAHLAAAWGTPVCVMYVHSSQELMPWYPVGTHAEALLTHTTDIANIPADAVLGALEQLFAYCAFPTE